jgi:hypothetical protein
MSGGVAVPANRYNGRVAGALSRGRLAGVRRWFDQLVTLHPNRFERDHVVPHGNPRREQGILPSVEMNASTSALMVRSRAACGTWHQMDGPCYLR